MSVVLDPGHGGKWNNAIGHLGGLQVYEKDLALQVVLAAHHRLTEAGVESRCTRYIDHHFSAALARDLKARADFAVAHQAFPFVSVHFNAADNDKVTGVETYVHPNADEKTWELARMLLAALANDTSTKFLSRGVKEANFAILRRSVDAGIPGVLVEGPFLTTTSQLEAVMEFGWVTEAGEALAERIIQWRKKYAPGS